MQQRRVLKIFQNSQTDLAQEQAHGWSCSSFINISRVSTAFDTTKLSFDGLWGDFLVEVEEPNWTFRAVGNLRNFASETLLIDLGDGVTIRGRNEEDLKSLCFNTPIWDRIADDWSGFGASSFVLVTEHLTPKRPDNLIFLNSYALSVKAMRAMYALRLAAEGAVGVGPMWVVRADRFNVGLGGPNTIGTSIPLMGAQYRWTSTLDPEYRSIYSDLARLDENKWYGRSPGNLEIAIRAFMATYDSWPRWPDWQLLNCRLRHCWERAQSFHLDFLLELLACLPQMTANVPACLN